MHKIHSVVGLLYPVCGADMSKSDKQLNIAMFGHKRVPSREGGVEIVVEELSTRMAQLGHDVTCYNRIWEYLFFELDYLILRRYNIYQH